MIVNYERRGFVDEPYLRVHQEHGLAMQLRQGSMEVGLQRSAIRLVSFPAGEMGLCAPHVERWIGSAGQRRRKLRAFRLLRPELSAAGRRYRYRRLSDHVLAGLRSASDRHLDRSEGAVRHGLSP